MIELNRSFDYDLIRRIMTDRAVYSDISDDGCPAAENFQPVESDALWYVIASDRRPDQEPIVLGLWLLVPQNTVCWEIHTVLLPHAWGPLGREAARAMAQWIWSETPCKRLITNVPEPNRLALHFAREAGMVEYGLNPASYLKHGKLFAQHCLGLSNPEVVCPQQQQLSPQP